LGGKNFYRYVDNRPTVLSEPTGLRGWWSELGDYYDDMRRRRAQGQRRFPGPENSLMRHCVISCESARDGGSPDIPRIMGVLNEIQGGLMHDLPHILSFGSIGAPVQGPGYVVVNGALVPRPWALDLEDLNANEMGVTCSESMCGADCETCCRGYESLEVLRSGS
jgi:hypothetical protein